MFLILNNLKMCAVQLPEFLPQHAAYSILEVEFPDWETLL